MVDIATLGLEVRSEKVEKAAGSLDRLTNAAKRAEMAALGIGNGAENAARRAVAANDNAARSAARAAQAFEGYNRAATLAARAMGAVVGAAAGSALMRLADAWSDMQSRVGAAIKDMDAAPALMQRIVDIANASYSSLDQTVEVYSRNVAVLRDLGRGATEAADFTEALNHALVITATRGERAASVQNALSKAMAVGKLQADGLETVLANGGRVAEVLATQLGTNVNGLRAFASQGKITGDVIASALIGNLSTLRDEAAEMPATIADAFTRINTNLTAFIGQLDKSAGASEAVATALLALGDNIGRIVTYGATAVTMFGTYYVAAFVAARAATITLTGALTLLRAALVRTGIGIAVVAAGELVYQFGRLVEATGSWGGAMQEVGRRAEILLDAVVWGFRMAGDTAVSVWSGAMADVLRSTEDSLGGILRLLGISAESVSASITRLEQRAGNMGEAAKLSASIAAEQFKRAFADIEIPEVGLSTGGNAGRIASDLVGIEGAAGKAKDAIKGVGDEAKTVGDKVSEFWADLTKGFVSDLRSGLEQGKGFWRSFGDAAMNVLDKIVDKLLNEVIDAIFRVNQAGQSGGGGGLFGWLGKLFNFGGGGGFTAFEHAWTAAVPGLWAKGGTFPNGIHGFSNTVVDRATPFMFAKGAGIMGEAGPEAIMPLKRGPDGRLGVSATNGGAANQNVRVEVEVFVNDDGTLGAIARQAGGEAADVRVKQGLAAYDKGRQKRYQAGGQFG